MEYTEQVDDPVDANGNSLSAYRTHPFLQRYDLIGVTPRKHVVMFDGINTQTALLDSDQSITMLEEYDLWGDSVAEFVVYFAGEFGSWKYVRPDLLDDIEQGERPDVDVPESTEVVFTTHAQEQWQDRGIDGVSIEDAWAESIEINWPFDEEMTAQFHPESTCTFLVAPPSVVTTYPPLAQLSPYRRQSIYDELPADHR